MRRIAAKEGGDTDTSRDYEYTEWKAVEAVANHVPGKATRTSCALEPFSRMICS